MNRHFRFLLMSMIIPLTLFAKEPFDDASTGNYIELQDMPHRTIHDPLDHDPHPQVPYHGLEDNPPANPDHDLSQTVPSQSTIQRHILSYPVVHANELLALLQSCLPCLFQADNSDVSGPNDSL